MNWIKKLFGSKPAQPEVAPAPVSEVDALVAENQRLGAMIDEIREKRRAIRAQIATLEALRIAAAPKGVTIGGK